LRILDDFESATSQIGRGQTAPKRDESPREHAAGDWACVHHGLLDTTPGGWFDSPCWPASPLSRTRPRASLPPACATDALPQRGALLYGPPWLWWPVATGPASRCSGSRCSPSLLYHRADRGQHWAGGHRSVSS
jgi:hypothetical protein